MWICIVYGTELYFCLFSLSLSHLFLWLPLPPPSTSLSDLARAPPPLPPHPSFLNCLPSSLLYLPPSTSSLPLHPFVSAAFKKRSHLGILTAFSRQPPAPQRDLNRGELWRVSAKNCVTPFKCSVGALWRAALVWLSCGCMCVSVLRQIEQRNWAEI